MTDLLNIPGFTKRRLAGACIAGPVLGIVLYGVLRAGCGWEYTPVVFAAVLLLGMGSFCVWAVYWGGG